MKKNVSIEILRVLACFFVVCIHILMNYRYIDDNPSKLVFFIESFVRCAVPIFLIISGFVLFPLHKKYVYYISNFFKRIFIPMIVVVMIIEYFNPYIKNEMSFAQNLREGKLDLERIFIGILKLDAAEWTNGFYFWYVFLLAGIYLMLPFINLLCNEATNNKKIRRYIIILTIIKNAIIPFFIKILPVEKGFIFFTWPFGMEIGFILIGYELKMIVSKVKGRKILLIGIFMYIVSTLLMYNFTMNYDVTQGEFKSLFFTWSDLFPLLQALGIFISIIALKELEGKKYLGVLYLGKISFNIYLLHYPVLIWLDYRGIAYKLYNHFSLGEYLIIYIIINFVVDIFAGSIVELIYFFCRKMEESIKNIYILTIKSKYK